MTRLEKCLLAIDKGYTYNPETGEIKSRRGRILKNKNALGYSYIMLYQGRKQFLLLSHHFAYYWVYGKIVHTIDHINGIKDDNRISNLREVTTQENCFNRKNCKGCIFIKKRNKWKAVIFINKKSKFLGYYDTYEEAHNIYLDEKKKHHIINH